MFYKCYAFKITLLSLSSKTFGAIEDILSGVDEYLFLYTVWQDKSTMLRPKGGQPGNCWFPTSPAQPCPSPQNAFISTYQVWSLIPI